MSSVPSVVEDRISTEKDASATPSALETALTNTQQHATQEATEQDEQTLIQGGEPLSSGVIDTTADDQPASTSQTTEHAQEEPVVTTTSEHTQEGPTDTVVTEATQEELTDGRWHR